MPTWACICAGDILLRREGTDGAFSLPIGHEPPVPLQPWNIVTKLEIGRERSATKDGRAQPSLISHHSSPILYVVRLDRPVTDHQELQMMPLRASFHVLSEWEYALAGKAAELIYWDQNTKYCGCCGAPMKLHTAISKRCTECGKELWPQLATAVIVRVTRAAHTERPEAPAPPALSTAQPHEPSQTPSLSSEARPSSPSGESGERGVERGFSPSASVSSAAGGSLADSEILLVHARNFRGPYYGLVAGFVETGETLEEAVRREVREETGLEITNLRYFGSQPWPFPCGLMVGFTARYASGHIHLQKAELSQGGWFTRHNLPQIPDKASIARSLIDDWLASRG